MTTPRSTSNGPIPTPTNKPSPTTPVIAGVTATFNSNNASVRVAGTYTCTSGTGNLRLGLTHEKNGVPNEYDDAPPPATLNCNGASVPFGPTTLNLVSGTDTWNNHDPVTVQVIFKFADGSTQAKSANVMATG